MDAIAVGMAIGLCIAGGTALLGPGRGGDALPGLIDAGGQAAMADAATGSPYDPWLTAGRPVDGFALPPAAAPAASTDVDPFWALARREDAAPSLAPLHADHDH